jgi:hypothetical protein
MDEVTLNRNHKLFMEPNFHLFKHCGLNCLVVRMSATGCLNGYVGVPKSHPLYKKEWQQEYYFDVHGGLTFSNTLDYIHEDVLGDLWWFGFDTAHLYDETPFLSSFIRDGIYRDMEYVIGETKSLAEQIEKKHPGLKIVVNVDYGGFGLSKEAYEKLGLEWDNYGYAYSDQDLKTRSDPRLVQVVEELGEKANGKSADLEVVQVPYGEYYFTEYDGIETLHMR